MAKHLELRRRWAAHPHPRGQRSVALLPAACLAALFGVSLVAQAPQGVFRSGIALVRLDAVVSDAQGHSVRDLAKQDFRLYEDGKLQTISEFVYVDDRADRSAAVEALAPPDVVSNRTAANGRLVVLVLDDLGTMRSRTRSARDAALAVIDQLTRDDLVAMLCTSGTPSCAVDFTNDRDVLRRAVGQFEARMTRFDREDSISGMPADSLNLGKAFGQLRTLQTVAGLAGALGEIADRRKALVLIGEGVDSDLSTRDPLTDGGFRFDEALQMEARRLVDRARRSHVTLYALDPREDVAYLREGLIRPPSDGDFEPWLDRARVAHASLGWLATQTGGFAALISKELDVAATRIARETASYYLLGYYPANQASSGKFRRLRIEVARPWHTVRARAGYFLSSPERHERQRDDVRWRLANAISGLLPVRGLSVSATAIAFRSGDRRHRTSLVVPSVVEYPMPGIGSLEDEVHLLLQVTDMNGKVMGTDKRSIRARRDAPVALGHQGSVPILRAEFLLSTDVPPGHYSLRVAAFSTGAKLQGSVFTTIDADDFDRLPLSMSGLVIARPEKRVSRDAERRRMPVGITLSPTTLRAFQQSERPTVMVRVYRRTLNEPDIRARLQVMNASGTISFDEPMPPMAPAPTEGVTDHQATIPLDRFPPGRYRLTVTARDGAVEAARETSLEIVQRRP